MSASPAPPRNARVERLLNAPIAPTVLRLVAHIGTNIGAGQIARAKRIAWTGASIAACVGLAIGAIVAAIPLAWAGLFSNDPAVLEACSQYLHRVGPLYPFLSVGVALYFASQGAGRMGMPLLAGIFRLLIASIGGFAVIRSGAPMIRASTGHCRSLDSASMNQRSSDVR